MTDYMMRLHAWIEECEKKMTLKARELDGTRQKIRAWRDTHAGLMPTNAQQADWAQTLSLHQRRFNAIVAQKAGLQSQLAFVEQAQSMRETVATTQATAGLMSRTVRELEASKPDEIMERYTEQMERLAEISEEMNRLISPETGTTYGTYDPERDLQASAEQLRPTLDADDAELIFGMGLPAVPARAQRPRAMGVLDTGGPKPPPPSAPSLLVDQPAAPRSSTAAPITAQTAPAAAKPARTPAAAKRADPLPAT
jgi:hypothetical protein